MSTQGSQLAEPSSIAALQAAVAQRIGPERFDLWFASGTHWQLDTDCLRLGVASQFFQDWMRSNFRHELESACREVLGRTLAVQFEVRSLSSALSQCAYDAQPAHDTQRARCGGRADQVALAGFVAPAELVIAPGLVASSELASEEKHSFVMNRGPASSSSALLRAKSQSAPAAMTGAAAIAGATAVTGATAEAGSTAKAATAGPRSAATATAKPSATEAVFKRRYAALEAFATGESNRLAHSAISTAARQLGKRSPLLIHGPTGVGKTHLVEGLVLAARRAQATSQALLLTAEQFTTHFLSALRGSGLPSFRRKHRGLSLLVIEDLQFFINKRATLTELLYTIDTLHREGRQLVFTADRPLEMLGDLGPEIVARLEGGLTCPIEQPDYGVRLEIVRRLGSQMGLGLSDEVCQFVAAQVSTHARALQGALKRLEAASCAHHAPITLELARTTLADVARRGRAIRLADIEAAICQTFGVEPKTLRSGAKARAANHPRMLAMWLARKHTRAALSEIGSYFGGRSHSTVISAQRRLDQHLGQSKPLELADGAWNADEAIRRVEQQLLAS